MRINVQVHQATLLLRMRNGEKRLAYGVVNALNNTAKRVQTAIRAHVEREFTVRRSEFVRREAAKISFASVVKSRLHSEVYVGQKPRFFLSGFETGGMRPTARGRRAAAPVVGGPARPSFGQQVPASYRFSALRLTKSRRLATNESPRRSRRASGGVRYGLQDTYQVPGVGVFKDVPGQTRGEPVYFFLEGQRLEGGRLDFMETATRTANAWFTEDMEREVVKAVEFDRGRSF